MLPYLAVKAFCLSSVQLSQMVFNSVIFLISGMGAWKQILQADSPPSSLAILQTTASLFDESCD